MAFSSASATPMAFSTAPLPMARPGQRSPAVILRRPPSLLRPAVPSLKRRSLPLATAALTDEPARGPAVTSGATAVTELPSVRYGEWNFRGFRCCYSAAGREDDLEAPAVVLVHGFGANCRHWRKNIAPLASRGFRVFAMDLIGFGLGDMPAPGTEDDTGAALAYEFNYWAAQLRAFCADVVRSDSVHFVANSIGSMVTMQASIDDRSLCRSHVFISPSLRQLNVRKRSWLQAVTAPIAMWVLSYRPLGAFFLNSIARPDQLRRVLLKAYAVQEAVDDELVAILRQPALQEGALEVFLAFIMYDQGPIPEDLLPDIHCPSLMLWGELDSFEPHRDGLALKHYATVERFVSLPGVGHCGQDEASEEVNALVGDFIEKHLSPANV